VAVLPQQVNEHVAQQVLTRFYDPPSQAASIRE
jgi:hypothetical protein